MNYKFKILTYAIWYILERFVYFYVTHLWCPIDHESIILIVNLLHESTLKLIVKVLTIIIKMRQFY